MNGREAKTPRVLFGWWLFSACLLAQPPGQVFLMGHSLGGQGTWLLGFQYPGKFAALAPVAGRPAGHFVIGVSSLPGIFDFFDSLRGTTKP